MSMLDNHVILVTGSTTGIGEAIARRAVTEGAQVMVHGLEEELAQQLCRELGKERSHYIVADISQPAACEQIVEATVVRFGRIDGLVNNAASNQRSNVDTTDAETFDHVIAINLRAPLLIARAAIRQFRQQSGGGNIVNIGSVNSLSGEPNLLAYSVSKGGLVTLTRNLANAHAGEHIRVNQLNPGWIPTPNELMRKQNEGLEAGWEKKVPKIYAPIGRMTRAEEVAAHVIFWLSGHSAPASGVVYEVDQTSPYGRNLAKAF